MRRRDAVALHRPQRRDVRQPHAAAGRAGRRRHLRHRAPARASRRAERPAARMRNLRRPGAEARARQIAASRGTRGSSPGAIDRVDGDPAPGATVRRAPRDGDALAAGRVFAACRRSARASGASIPTRPSTTRSSHRRIARGRGGAGADARRQPHGAGWCTASRMGCRASSPTATATSSSSQLSSAGAERWRDAIVEALAAATGATCVYERSDAEVRDAGRSRAAVVGVAAGHLPQRSRRSSRTGLTLSRRRRGRPEDGVLPRPARQPARASARWPPGDGC